MKGKDGEQPPEASYLRVSGVWTPDNRLILRPSYLSWNPRDAVDLRDSPVQAYLFAKDELLLRWGVAVGAYSDREGLLGLLPVGESGMGPARAFRPVRAKIPWPEETDLIVFEHDDVVLAEIRRPEHPPELSAVRVQETKRTYRISWRAKHPDKIPVYYHLRTSADRGKTWSRLASRLTKTKFSVDRAALVGGSKCVLEVVAYDGVNTVRKAVRVASSGPPRLEVRIISPTEGKKALRPPIALEAVGRIPGRFGALGDIAECAWFADGEEIAQGPCVVWSDPKPGSHEVVFRAHCRGYEAEAKVRITIARRT